MVVVVVVVVVVSCCGATKEGSFDFRAPDNLLIGRAGICAGVSHNREAEGYLQWQRN